MSLQVHRFPHINHRPFISTLERLRADFEVLEKPNNRIKTYGFITDPHPRFLIPLKGFRKDLIWDIEMENAIEEALSELEHGCFNSAEKLLSFLAEKYRDYVNKKPVSMGEHYIEKAGRWRKKDEGERCSVIKGARLPYEDRANALTGTPKGVPGEHIMREFIDGIPVDLTRTRKTEENPNQIEWIYTKPLISYAFVLPYLENLFKEFLALKEDLNNDTHYRTEKNLENIITLVAKTHWWLAHGMFFLQRQCRDCRHVYKSII